MLRRRRRGTVLDIARNTTTLLPRALPQRDIQIVSEYPRQHLATCSTSVVIKKNRPANFVGRFLFACSRCAFLGDRSEFGETGLDPQGVVVDTLGKPQLLVFRTSFTNQRTVIFLARACASQPLWYNSRALRKKRRAKREA
jgi:hypothetical protein